MNLFKSAVLTVVVVFASLAEANETSSWQVKDILAVKTPPFAIGHRGVGANLGEDPSRPKENTISAVRLAFLNKVPMVQIEVQVTQDGQAVLFHDDVLADGTCINTLTFKQLRRAARDVPQIPTLKGILQVAQSFSHNKNAPSGILDIEVNAPSAKCDPNNIYASKLLEAVLADVKQADMLKQIIIESYSPAILTLATDVAPDVARVLTVNALQFQTSKHIADTTEALFLLPSYDSIEEFIQVALDLGTIAVDLDMLILQRAEQFNPDSGSLIVTSFNVFDLSVWSFNAANQADWEFLNSMGINGIITDGVPLGLILK